MAVATEGQLEAAYVAGKRLVIASVRTKLDEMLEWPATQPHFPGLHQTIAANPLWSTIRVLLQHLDALEMQEEEEV